MTKELEALKRLRQETCPATYMADFDKNECCDVIEQALQRLEAIDNSNPSEALECWQWINATIPQWVREKDKEHPNVLEPIKQALLKAEQDKKKLNEIEKLTHLLYSKRRKIGQEYIKWCEKNNAVFDDATTMITWVLAIKLKEVLYSE